MIRKDILELKRRFKKDQCTFTKMCGCYVNGEKEILLKFRETFLNLPDEAYYKYLEIAKKVLSGTIGNNLLELHFPLEQGFQNPKQDFLMKVKNSGLKDDEILDDLYESIIETYDYPENYLILIFHDAYDVMTKTSDNLILDESEEVYEYVLCAICPVALATPGLSYYEKEQAIMPRIRDWVVGVPIHGFTYPAFNDRSSDPDAIMYYTKNAKDPHPELMEEALGCSSKITSTIQKETFQEIIQSAVGPEDEEGETLFVEVQESLKAIVEEHNEIYEDTDEAPVTLTKEDVQQILVEKGVSEEACSKIETSFEENFGDDLPLAESLIDKKILKANEHKKKEEELTKQVALLEDKLEQVAMEVASEPDHAEEVEEDEVPQDQSVDVVLHVKPDKLPEIKTEIINGKKCIVVPMDDHEEATINGQKNIL